MSQPLETSGALGFLSGPELLRNLLLRKATGQLVVYRGEVVKKLFFKSGAVLYATSNLPEDRLGNVLLARGMITREQFEQSASQTVATGRKQGTVLVQLGALSPKDLFRGLIAQVREIVLSICAFDAGDWRFLEGLPPQEDIVSLRLHTAGLVVEGVLRTAADPRWESHWDPRGLQLEPAASPPFAPEELDLPDSARRLLALVEQGRPFEEMARLVGAEPREAACGIYALALLGLVEARPAPPPAAAPAPPAPAAPAEAPAAEDPETLALREKIQSLAARLGTLSHYQVLGVEVHANAETIKRAYIGLARDFHPDRFFRPEFEDLQEKVNAIFMRVNEALTTLQNPAARADYDRAALRLTAPLARALGTDDDSSLAREQFNRGVSLLNCGDLWTAIQALRWAVSLAPQNPRYHTYLGVALTRTKKRLHEAEEHCKTAIALDYNNAQYYVHLGQVYRTGHLTDKARKQFETALKLDPRHAGALKELRELDGEQPGKGLLDRLTRK